jgi:hypothetical protein
MFVEWTLFRKQRTGEATDGAQIRQRDSLLNRPFWRDNARVQRRVLFLDWRNTICVLSRQRVLREPDSRRCFGLSLSRHSHSSDLFFEY